MSCRPRSVPVIRLNPLDVTPCNGEDANRPWQAAPMHDERANTGAPKVPRLLDKVREAIRRLHYSDRTEEVSLVG
jgi:hypothetical protein